MEIKIGTIGKIVAGNEVGSFVKVIHDAKSTGGFFILTSSTPEMKDGFDSWVENESALEQYFIESRWVIHWL